MNTIKKILMLSIMASAFVACSSDDDSSSGRKNVITSLDDPDFDPSNLKGIIAGNIDLPKGEYILSGGLVVEAPYELKIQPGTTFKAVAGGTDVYLVVEQGATINAQGTTAEPIVFTSNAANPAAGNWGGVILCGYAPISGGGTAITEVVDHIYGGNEADDDSGILSHVIIEYTGARINGEKEFNGLTLYGVGSDTQISDIAIYNGDDDSIEFFGGSVDVTNLLVVNAKDDLIDWTQGYNGTITNAYAIREESYTAISSDPRGIEADGNLDGNFPNQTGQSNPTITGFTMVNNAAATLSDIFKIRRGSGVTMTNTLVVWGANAVAPGDFVDFKDDGGDGASGANLTITATGAALDMSDIAYPVENTVTVTITEGTTGGANTSVFGWTGYQF